MSTHLHLDLLKEEERFSSSPVRLRIVVPMMAGVATVAFTFWWVMLACNMHSQTVVKRGLQESIESLKKAHASFVDLRLQGKESSAQLQQLRFYERSRIRFGTVLTQLPELVPDKVQLTELRVSPPPPPQLDPKQPELGPTNTTEAVSIRFAGRTSGEKGSAYVDALLASLRKPAYSNLIWRAEIPKGAFRQDVARAGEKGDALLFEITCACSPRRFE